MARLCLAQCALQFTHSSSQQRHVVHAVQPPTPSDMCALSGACFIAVLLSRRILEVMSDDDIALCLTPQAFHNVNVSQAPHCTAWGSTTCIPLLMHTCCMLLP